MDVEAIKDKVRDYLKDDLDNYAILINGGWGTGKTFLYENHLREIINSIEVGKQDGKRDIYISLYGIRTIQELSDELLTSYILFSKLHAKKESKKSLKKAQTIVSMFTKSIKLNFSSVGVDIGEFVNETKNLFEIKQLVICFDDLERCEIPINILFGYINNLVEHHKCKVIILADESNIGKIHANTNVEAKYSTILTGDRKINFESAIQKQNDSNKSDGLSVSQLKNYSEQLYSENYLYRDIKEKVVRRTYNYQPSVSNILLDISKQKERIKNDEYRKFINEKATKIASYFASAGSSNLRIIFLWIKNFESLYLSAKEKISDNEYYEYILAEYMRYSVWKLVSKELNIPLIPVVHDVRYYNYSLESEVYLDNNKHSKINAYYFIDPWILSGEPDEKNLVYYAERINNNKRKEALYIKNAPKSTGKELRNLYNWKYMDDESITCSVEAMFNELNENKYVFDDYEAIIILLNVLKNKVGFDSIRIEEFLRGMEDLISKDDKVCDLRFIHWEYEVYKEELQKLMQLREQRNFELDASVLERKGAYDSVDRFCEECNLRKEYYVENKSFIGCVNIESLIILLEKASLKEIYDIRDVFVRIYRMGNIKDYFSDDLGMLVKLLTRIGEIKEGISSRGKTYKYAIDKFYTDLGKIIERLK